ncbi:UvrD-helicase domain-containing protein [Collinsella sp. zg1085]|uniref:HelD family protein n=1 Tax=Collinsella sp. zg1085 TaxID=2844380 RepID=UPI001C0DBC98|nr:UvrD-helicase domain-containing protein [Collinsella sp. zg1085]QWT17932.1 UvrD-helicase domain-containing protein [Collinsella sp. zg1085]
MAATEHNLSRSTDDLVMQEEQEHLSELYATLLKLRDELSHELDTKHEQAAADLRSLSQEIRPNFTGWDETLETLAAIESLNLVIDTYNQYHDFNVDKLRKILLLLRQPYFAKVKLKMRPDRPARDVYIGTAGLTDDHHIPLVVDWRNPIAETYYNQENGQTSYTVHGALRTVELLLRRQFDIDRDMLKDYFDTTVAIEDSLLLHALRSHHSEKLKAITATIQREQNEVVRHEDVPVMLVSGIAGSGKTSVMLQRIAYLLYHEHERLAADQVYLFTPNKLFEHYIDGVLPSLGEANPQLYTWQSFIEHEGAGNRDDGSHADIKNLEKLEQALPSLCLHEGDVRAITVDGETLLSASQVAAVVNKHSKFGLGPQFTTLVSDELRERLARRLASFAHDEVWQERLQSMDVEEQIRLIGSAVNPADDEEMATLTRNYVDILFAEAGERAIDTLAWLKLDRVGMRVLGLKTLSATDLLYLRLLLMGRASSRARYVMIDEVQDYSAAQLKVLSRFFIGAHFLLLGDPNQAIREGTPSFEEIQTIFEASHGQVDVCRLLTSYRSSPEVTALFSGLVNLEADIKLASVRRAGTAAVRLRFETEEALLAHMRPLLTEAMADTQTLTAVLLHDQRRAARFAKQLDNLVPFVRRNEVLPATGAVIMTLDMAKGLEFDHVIIADADERNYPDTLLARRRLYTAISRAMHQVSLFAVGSWTPLLAEDGGEVIASQ